jgi:hypothetical protein
MLRRLINSGLRHQHPDFDPHARSCGSNPQTPLKQEPTMATTTAKPSRRNPVAKYAAQFQRASSFRDRTKYRRTTKHKGREPFPLSAASR